MNEIPHHENRQKSLQFLQSLRLIELLKKLLEEIGSLDVEQSLTSKKNKQVNQILDDFIEQCLGNGFDSTFFSDLYQLDQDHYLTKRGNCYSFENGLKIYKCQKCSKAFETPQKLGNHSLIIHPKIQKIQKQIKKH